MTCLRDRLLCWGLGVNAEIKPCKTSCSALEVAIVGTQSRPIMSHPRDVESTSGPGLIDYVCRPETGNPSRSQTKEYGKETCRRYRLSLYQTLTMTKRHRTNPEVWISTTIRITKRGVAGPWFSNYAGIFFKFVKRANLCFRWDKCQNWSENHWDLDVASCEACWYHDGSQCHGKKY